MALGKQTAIEEHASTPGYAAQLEAYGLAWKRCSDRVQVSPPSTQKRASLEILHTRLFYLCTDAYVKAIITEVQAPIVSAVKKSIQNAYSHDVLPALPYVELPVIAVSGSCSIAMLDRASHTTAASSGCSSVINDVVVQLRGASRPINSDRRARNRQKSKRKAPEHAPHNEDSPMLSLVTHLHSTECASVVAAMKSIVSGFVDRQDQDINAEDIERTSAPYRLKSSLMVLIQCLRRQNGKHRPRLLALISISFTHGTKPCQN